jgi:hypothetical protein
MLIYRFCAIGFAILCTSCMPLRYTASPSVKGQIVEAGSGRPLGNATVSVRVVNISGVPSQTALTGSDGSFKTDRVEKTDWIPIPEGTVDPVAPRLEIVVEAPDYNQARLQIPESYSYPDEVDLGVVRLSRR